MKELTTEGVVVRSVVHGDAHLIVSLYTRDGGRISALARNARGSRKRFGGGLNFFMRSRFIVKIRGGGDLWTLESAELLESFGDLASDLAAYTHGSYVTELVRELTPQEQPDAEILDLLLSIYRELATNGVSVAMLRSFELGLLAAVGLAPVIDRCVVCESQDDIDGEGWLMDPARGGIVCPRCAVTSRSGGVRALAAGVRRYLAACAAVDDVAMARPLDKVAGELAPMARDANLGYLLWHIGKPLRSIEFLSKVSGALRHGGGET